MIIEALLKGGRADGRSFAVNGYPPEIFIAQHDSDQVLRYVIQGPYEGKSIVDYKYAEEVSREVYEKTLTERR